MKRSSGKCFRNDTQRARCTGWLLIVMLLQAVGMWGQQIQAGLPTLEALHGRVVDAQGQPVADATVSLRTNGANIEADTKTDREGKFSFSALPGADYQIGAQKADRQSGIIAAPHNRFVTLILESGSTTGTSGSAMEFSDQPHFSVAGVTDWTAAGGHGSDTILRTSELLTNATVTLKADSSSKKTGTTEDLAKSERADAYRLAGRLDERQGNPLRAVEEFEQAATLDPSEQNQFEWASELLLHRAVSQAEEVFRKGAISYPNSMRMQAGFGAALFAGSRYEEAASQLCKASDLEPSATDLYVSLGEVEIAAPNPLGCVKSRLNRFMEMHPESAAANYLYAMALLKDRTAALDSHVSGSAKVYLNKAVSLDPRCSEAYLQLGVLAAAQSDQQAAINLYLEAIQVNSKLADAHYRLGVAYDRVGERAKAQQEFALHQQMKQQQAEAVEEQRKMIKQFLFAEPDALPVAPMK